MGNADGQLCAPDKMIAAVLSGYGEDIVNSGCTEKQGWPIRHKIQAMAPRFNLRRNAREVLAGF